MANIYINPRMDFPEQRGNALSGKVKLDPLKTVWVGVMVMFGTVGSALTFSPSSVLVFILFTGFTLCFGHSLGMHRRFIHRSYQCHKWLEILFVHLGTIVGLGGPYGMLRTHDLRDWAQRQSDCHNYFSHGQAWYRDAYWQIFCSIELENPPSFQVEESIIEDKIYQIMEKTWMLQQAPWAIAFYFIGGWGWVFWGICSRVSISILGHWLIGYFAHNDGHRSWHVEGAAVQGHNIRWVSLLTMGENWHNNHHAFPFSAKLGLEHDQWDPGWWMLLVMEKVGLAWNLVTPELNHSRVDLHRMENP